MSNTGLLDWMDQGSRGRADASRDQTPGKDKVYSYVQLYMLYAFEIVTATR